MIGRLLRAQVIMMLAAVTVCETASAHSDPEGDVHPKVFALPGAFELCFRSNLNTISTPSWFRVLYKPDGTVIAPRHRMIVAARVKSLEGSLGRFFPGEDARDPAIFLIGEQGFRETKPAAPTRLVLRTWKDGAAVDEPLLLDASTCTDLTAQLVTKDWAALLWNSNRSSDFANPDPMLKLTWFTRGSTVPPVTRDLGVCPTVYTFANASNLVWTGGRIWVAWASSTQERHCTMLSSFDPVSGKLESKMAREDGAISWISLAATDGWLCAAWHSGVRARNGEKLLAEIFTVFEKLPEAP